VRVDSGVLAGSEITPLYDPMVAKLIVRDVDRESATRRMARALEEFEIAGVRTLLPFHKAIMASEQWAKAETCRDLIEDKGWLKRLAVTPPPKPDDNGAEVVARDYVVEVGGKRFDVKVHGEAMAAAAPALDGVGARPAPKRERRAGGGAAAGGDELHSPLQGNVFKVLVDKGAKVEEGALVCIIEAMKMENEITAHKAGVIADLPIAEGAAVSSGDLLAVIKSE
jgi:acetyl-CoA/propionyl-CoA carboxylase biotin carboxyl carrier protein